MKNVFLIGCGGINSWSCEYLKQLQKDFEIQFLVKVFDDDIVEEKNVLQHNQNFIITDVMEKKAKLLAKRYVFDYENVKITASNLSKLDSADIVIIGVDNNKTRKLIYEYCITNKKKLIDLRAHGADVQYVVLDTTKTIQYYTEKYFSGDMEKVGGCQLRNFEETKKAETGNRIIAFFGVFGLLLKMLRGDEIVKKESRWVY